jgi:peptide/nickel transport system substrate-binding protein
LLVCLFAVTACDAGGVFNPLDRGPTTRTRSIRPVTHDAETIIVGRPGDAISLDPALVTDNESVEIAEQLYDKLLNYRAGTNEVEPGLATSWETSDGGRVWTFHLREGVRFHDGTPFNADAVVFSFERQRDPFHDFYRDDYQYWKGTYGNILEIQALDPYTVRISIEEPYSPFEANMAMFPVAIVSPTAVRKYGADYGEHAVGTGPFKLVRWERNERVVLARNPDYWGGAPEIERLVFQTIPDARQRLIALEGGALDIAYSILPEELQFVELHPDLDLHRTPANNVTYLAMNTTHPPFDDVRVRRAANYAINKEPIVKLLYQGQAIAAQGPLPPTQWGYHELVQPYQYDPPKARELLGEAEAEGRFDGSRTYTLYAPSTPRPYVPDPAGVARALQANLADVGIKTQLVMQSFNEHIADARTGAHDLCLLGWVGDNGDPDNFLYVLFDANNTTPGSARNVAFLRDDALHGLLSWAQQESDREQREHYYARAQDLIHETAPWVPLAHSQVNVAARLDLGGLVISPSGIISYKGVLRE